MIIPNALKKGDTIGVIAPSDSIDEDNFVFIQKSSKLFEDLGFKIKLSEFVSSNSLGYSASPLEKAKDVNNMFANPDIKAIFIAKGGENSNTTFDYLDYELIKKNPKILCGFSDSTSITNAITAKTDLITFSGATFKSLTSWETDYAFKEVAKRFIDKNLEFGTPDDRFETFSEGTSVGRLIGGNLSLISQMVCGKYSLDFSDKILFIEELGFESSPARVSSYLYYMKQNGVFDKIKGLWIGNYEHPSKYTLEKIVLDVLGNDFNFPIIKSNNFGHVDKKTVVPIGSLARIDTSSAKKIELIENCVN